MSIADSIVDGIDGMRKIIQSARAVPQMTSLPENSLKTIVNTAFVAAILVFANRALMHPETLANLSKVGVHIVVAAGSLLFVFLISALICLAKTDRMAEGVADRWSVVFAFMWLVTLFVFLIDQLLGSPVKWVINQATGGELFGLDRGLIFAFFIYTLIAYAVLTIRTYRLEKRAFFGSWSIFALLTIIPFCVTMLYIFIKVATAE